LSAEVLSRISLRTGLRFDVEQGSSLPRQIDEVSSGRVDMLASVIPSIERSEKIRFTRPYLSNPYVLVVAADNDRLITLEDMPGKRLALINGNNLIMEITGIFRHRVCRCREPRASHGPGGQGSVDATVVPLISARYMIARHYRTACASPAPSAGNLRALPLASTAVGVVFDPRQGVVEHHPEEMDELTNHWRSEIIIEDSYWARHRNVIIQGFGLAALLLLVTLGWVFYLRNLIRKRAQAERALSDQMRFMSVLIDGTPHPIYVRDRQGRLMACNNAYLDVFGFKLEDVIGKTVVETDTGNPPQAQSFHADYLRLMEQGEPQIHDRVLKVPGGGVMTIYQWMLPYRDSNGNVVGMIAGWVDVSERQRLLGQLQEAKEEADAANRAKTTFLATMSHEIRTPMNAVIGMIELALKNAEQGQVDRDALEVASVASRSMLELIGDILDIARIESGHLSLSLEPANLYELLASVGGYSRGWRGTRAWPCRWNSTR
jgi:two-component system sensor histidine kinase EvgS